ncbi:hypothetical protein VLK31_19270 [Variovorax sp. H27-G14]|uniref:hypothetical protein n=1 Tax=Variovorax sp. H27-G14 TaxID=3111914 RepID=UPI0038FC8CEF
MKIFLVPFFRSEIPRPTVDTNVVHQVLALDFSGGPGMLPWQINCYDHVDLHLSEIPECRLAPKPKGRQAGSADPCATCACRLQLEDASVRFQERLFAAAREFAKVDRWFECARLIGPHQVARLAMGFKDGIEWAREPMPLGRPTPSEIEMDRILIRTSFYRYIPPMAKETVQPNPAPSSSGTDEPDQLARLRA